MDLTTAFLAAVSALGLLGFALLVAATVVMAVADLRGHDLLDLGPRAGRSHR